MFLIGSLYKDLLPKGLFASNKPLAAITTDTTTVGAIIDTHGFFRTLIGILTGTITDGAYDIQLFHGDDAAMADEAQVLTSDLNGTITDLTATSDDIFNTVEYIGRKRFIRAKVVSTGVTTGGTVGLIALLGQASKQPQQT